MNPILATIVSLDGGGPMFLGWRISGHMDAPMWLYVGGYLISIAMMLFTVWYMHHLLRRFVRKYPVVTAASLKELRHTIIPGKSVFGMALAMIFCMVFWLLLPCASVVMLILSFGVYDHSFIWLLILLWAVVVIAVCRFDWDQTRVLFTLPCSGRDVYDFSRLIFARFGLVFRIPILTDGPEIIDPEKDESIYCHIGGFRIKKIMLKEACSLLLFPLLILFEAFLLYEPLMFSRTPTGVQHYFRPDGSLSKETSMRAGESGLTRYYSIYFDKEGRIDYFTSRNKNCRFGKSEDGVFRLHSARIGDYEKIYSRRNGVLLFHGKRGGEQLEILFESPDFKTEEPDLYNFMHEIDVFGKSKSSGRTQ